MNLKTTHPLIFSVLLSASAFAQSNPQLITTFTNPTPAAFTYFGTAVAPFGSDRVLVGTDSLKAHLLSDSGKLLTTFTVADPAAGGFGYPLMEVGDRVLISAYSYGTTAQNGRSYLFTTNGVLGTTFTNPNPARVQAFGVSAAALGSDRVFIAGPEDSNVGVPYQGTVFLFRTNGTVIRSIVNPHSTFANGFGIAISTLGNDRVIVGAPGDNTGALRAGVAFLFNTNGALLTTFTNPVPVASDSFGFAVAAVGNDRVLVGAIADGGEASGGATYLFTTNGTLLTTFTNPTPAAGDSFGHSVAAVGTSRVLIGAYLDDTDTLNAGAAYLFSTNGTLLNTITNPTPAVGDGFGVAVAALGKDRILITAPFDNTGANNAGAVYLYELPYPLLSIARNGPAVSLKWTTPETGIGLQQAGVLGTPPVWSNVPEPVSVNGLVNVVQQTMVSTNRFFRLRRP